TFAAPAELSFDADLTAIVGPNGSGKCVGGDTLVVLSDGRELPIREIVEAALAEAQAVEVLDDGQLTRENRHCAQVLSLDPATLQLGPRRVSAFIKRRAPAQLVRVRTRSGREVLATAYHPLFTLVDGRLRTLEAGDLQPGIRVAVPRRLPVSGGAVGRPQLQLLDTLRRSRIYVPTSDAFRAWADLGRARFGPWTAWRRAAGGSET